MIRNQNRRSVIGTINYDVDKILLYCRFNSSYNRKDISMYRYGLFEYIMSLTEKYIGDISKEFLDKTAANERLVFGLR